MASYELYILVACFLISNQRCLAATNFCQQPLGMERRIITNSQISESSTYSATTHKGYEARLNNNRGWCSATATQTNQYVKVDFGRLLSVTGIAIQGDPNHPSNYITKFKLEFTTDGSKYLYKIDSTNVPKEFDGANGPNQLKQNWFLTKPFSARILKFEPTARASLTDSHDTCVRFELYGCAYVCGGGLGIESGLSLPSGFTLSASSSKAGFEASNGRLSGTPSWCASSNNVNSEYLQIDFGRIITMTGIAIQGNPNADSWVKEFYLDYGTSSSSLVTYQEGGVSKVFVGNNDRSTIVVNWFLVRLTARYVRVKPKTVNGDICMRIEITGCDSEFVGEIGAENRVLEDSRFQAFNWSNWFGDGRYAPKDGRLNNDRPWGRTKTDTSFMWFKVDLGRVFLVNGIATQGDGTYGPNFFPDYKLDFSLTSPGSTVVNVKEETFSAVKIFPGNTNNQGVKFNFLSNNPISARYIQFLKHTQPAHDYNLRVEIYGRPQACWKSFGMVDGENPSFVPSVTVSSGTVPLFPKLNAAFTWCARTHDANQHIQFDLGSVKTVSGIAIQGHRGQGNWVKSFKIKYGDELPASNTFMDGSSEKVFVGSNTNELIVYNWFPSDINARYVQILPQTWQNYICLRANLYGCPESGCFERIGIESTSQVANSLITSSTFASGKEAYKGRLNSYNTWAACEVGSCSPKESGSVKPWIQVCLGSAHTFSAIIIQGYGNADDVALVNEFSVKYGYTSTFHDYHYGGALKKFAGATGRYASKQINLPVTVAAKCLRLQIEAKTPSTKDAGLRWELLGCNSVSKVAIVLSQASAVVSRGNQISLTCSVKNQPGFNLSWKSSGTALTNSDIYSVENEARTSSDVDGTTSRVLRITAKASTIANTYTCTLSDATQGHVSCTQTLSCAASYSEMSDLSNSKSITITVTGLIGKPSTPNGISSSDITNTSVKITWSSASADFPITQYSISIKKKSDGSIARPTATTSSLLTSFNTLTPYTDYIIEITAKTKYNVLSDKGTHEFKTDEGAAQSPLETKASADSNTTITVTWKQPSVLNGVLHSYLVRYKLTSSSAYSTSLNVGTNVSKAFHQLDPYTDYDFQVAATTKGGTITGTWSSVIEEKTLEGLPLEPRNLTASTIQSSSAVFNWLKPMKENGIIRNYTMLLEGRKVYNGTFSHKKSLSVSGGVTSYPVNDLVPGSIYSLVMAAITGAGQGPYSTKFEVATFNAAPPRASIIKQVLSNGYVEISLRRVSDINGPIKEYQILVGRGSKSTCTAEITKETIPNASVPMNLTLVPGKEAISDGVNFQLDTIGNFTFCFRALVSNESNILYGEAGSTVVERKTLKSFDASVVNVTDTQLVIPLVAGPTGTTFYQIIVIEHLKTPNFSPNDTDTYKPSMLGPYDNSAGVAYITAEFSTFISTFTIGDGKAYSKSKRQRRNTGSNTYTNSPLKPETSYSVFQRAYINSDVYYSSNWIGPMKTDVEVPTTKKPTAKEQTSKPKVGLIIGIVAPIIIIIALAGAVFLFLKRRKNADKAKASEIATKDLQKMPYEIRMEPHPVGIRNNSYREEEGEDEDEVTNVDNQNAVDGKSNQRAQRRRSSAGSFKRKKPLTEVGHDRHHPPMSVQDFAKHCKHMQKDSHHGITQEYKALKTGQLFPWDVAMRPENKAKNRYANIAAYDHSRVRIKQNPDSQSSDYINANFISNYTRPSVYIASQGPVDKSEPDFWRMIWDNNVSAIVMVTNLVERGRMKCMKYWPDGGDAIYGEISISLVSMDNYVDYVIRCFSVRRRGYPDTRNVYHFHFVSWPDHGVPEFPTDLLNFRKRVRKYFPSDTEQPILVHCSAGVGRTGTFIVIDAMLDLIAKQQKVDIFNFLNFIRTQRIQLVQVEDQYVFIYLALLEAITCGITEIETQNLRITINQLRTTDQHGQNGFEHQFERLNILTHKLNATEALCALKPVNVVKNRSEDILPRDLCRVVLQQSIYENDNSDYINATFVDGYKQKDAFIATEYPLPETIQDFWTMAYQRATATIVILSSPKEVSESYPVFWPASNRETRYGNINVFTAFENNENIGIRRGIKLRHRDSPDEVQDVEMYHFTSWPNHGVPENCKLLLLLLNLIEKSQQKHGNKPIIILCSDGAGRTGTFLAIQTILERFKTEQLIDVFQTIKKIRFFRPKFVENAIQYQFCHSMAQAYMESFDTYANFGGY